MGKEKGLPDRLAREVAVSFPNLDPAYEVTSPIDSSYNCIAHAAQDSERWWCDAEDSYWPEGAEREGSLAALKQCYEAEGFAVCDNSEPEPGYTKIALYVDAHGRWTHAARQVDGGKWTSKLGQYVDIRHLTPECVGGPEYGEVACFMRRPEDPT